MDRGYIKLWRKTQDNTILFSNLNVLGLFTILLLRSEWKDGRKVWFNGSEIELKKGQLTCGRKELARSLKTTEDTIRWGFHQLRNSKIITTNNAHNFTIVTILNWDTYQSSEENTPTTYTQSTPTTTPTTTPTLKEYNIKNKEINHRFDAFWSKYPKKVGKENARKAFQKLDVDDSLLNNMLSSLSVWGASEQWTKEDGAYIPHPATWLNGKRWEDELTTNGAKNPYANLPRQVL